MRFSIIVPVYNTCRYLEACINSVLAQGFGDWEMLIVDDGSTDGSSELAEDFARRDRRIQVLHRENGGQFHARQDGLLHARGEYILFLDSDDYWSEDCLQTLSSAVEEFSPDVLMFAGERFGDDNRENNVIGTFSEKLCWCEKERVYQLLISGNDCNSLCLKAIKRSMFDGDTTDYGAFGGICVGEDKVRLLYPITHAEKILFLPKVLYYYRYNTKSAVHCAQLSRIPDMMANNMFSLVHSYAKQWGVDDAQGRETMAVYYLRQFIQVFYTLRRSCESTEQFIGFYRYPWKKVLDKRAVKYIRSKKLTPREKLKLGVALICVYL